MDRSLVGVVKQGPMKKWLDKKRQWDQRFASSKKKVHKQFAKDLAIGYEGFGEGEFPPPSALAGRRKKEGVSKTKKRKKSMGLAMWSLWVSTGFPNLQKTSLASKHTDALSLGVQA